MSTRNGSSIRAAISNRRQLRNNNSKLSSVSPLSGEKHLPVQQESSLRSAPHRREPEAVIDVNGPRGSSAGDAPTPGPSAPGRPLPKRIAVRSDKIPAPIANVPAPTSAIHGTSRRTSNLGKWGARRRSSGRDPVCRIRPDRSQVFPASFSCC